MQLLKTIKWLDPLKVANSINESEEKFVFLYSGFANSFTGQNSYIALKPQQEISDEDFVNFANSLSSDKDEFDNAWFGYLGYGLKNSIENLPSDKKSKFSFSDLWFCKFKVVLHFDHLEEKVNIWSDSDFDMPNELHINISKVEVNSLQSNMTSAEYFKKVNHIIDSICKGDVYQANLTRKFSGKFLGDFSPFNIFCNLSRISPAPYSAFIKIADKSIISSSPERFLYIDKEGLVDTRPIKGSAARSNDKKLDNKYKKALSKSIKDRAENLMIVDLCRNDLSRSCKLGSVKTKNLFEISSYATVHHMASTITGYKNEHIPSIEVVKGCFPPGSMTGTPKIKAMQLCTELEEDARGVYAGGIGWFGGDGSVDLSVVIRTIIIEKGSFEFQVGGAIVYDSDPKKELEETMTKAKAICMAMGIDLTKLSKL